MMDYALLCKESKTGVRSLSSDDNAMIQKLKQPQKRHRMAVRKRCQASSLISQVALITWERSQMEGAYLQKVQQVRNFNKKYR